jgi:hypothetical protein
METRRTGSNVKDARESFDEEQLIRLLGSRSLTTATAGSNAVVG